MGSGKKQLHIQVEAADSVSIIRLSGSVDAANIDDFARALNPICDCPKARVLLDCSRLTYVNSTCYDLLFHFHRICRTRRGRFALFSVRRKIANILDILGLDSILKIYPSRVDALKAIKKTPAR